MNIEIWLFATAIVWLPGAAIARLIGSQRSADIASRIALEIALGLSFWPVIFLWTSFLPLQWTGWVVRTVVGVAAAVAFFGKGLGQSVRWITFWSLLLSGVLLVTAWTRLRAIAGLVLPPWVDAVHHAMIVRLFLMRGTVPSSYEPFITDAASFYHWGYHAITAALCWFSGKTTAFEVPAVMLSFGQWLNALTPLFVYAAARALAKNRTAAVIAAALAGLVSYYPAYYVSWGRYTHLTGVLLLLAWIALASSSRISSRSVAALAIVAAGLTLVHVRLAFFAATYALVMLAIRRRRAVRLLLAASIAAILLAPWLIQMTTIARIAIAPNESRWTTPSDVHESNLWVPHAAELLSVATAGVSGMANIGAPGAWVRVLSVVWWIAIILVYMRRKTRSYPFVVLLAWVALTMLLLQTALQFASNTAAAITMWVPVCIGAGFWSAAAIQPLSSLFKEQRHGRRTPEIVITILCVLIGIRALANVVNPGTVIANDADLAALRWFAHAPANATIIGRIRGWYGGAFIGADGAYWSSVLADRRSLPPPSLYRWTKAPEAGAEMALFLGRWQSEYPRVSEPTISEAKRLGVTHAYFARGTPSFGRVAYSRDGVVITELP